MLFVDSDGVIANFWQHYLDNHNKDFGTNYTVDMMENNLPTKKPYQDYVNEGNWYNNLPEFPWTKTIIDKLLNKKQRWAILTSVEITSKTATWEKYQWYKQRGIDEKKIIICNNKASIITENDILIDDSIKNITSLKYFDEGILVAQPYNKNSYDKIINNVGYFKRLTMDKILNDERFWE
jgi:5'(3')-deoxyribonucleotidase